MTKSLDSNSLTALEQQLDREEERIGDLKRDGKYPLSRDRLIQELKTNSELRQAVRDVLLEVTA